MFEAYDSQHFETDREEPALLDVKPANSEKGDSNEFFFQLVRSFLTMTPCVVRSRHDDACSDCAVTDNCEWYKTMVDIASRLKQKEEK